MLEISQKVIAKSDLEIVIHVNNQHYQSFKPLIDTWANDIKKPNIRFETSFMNHVPDFKESNTSYTLHHYENWIADLKCIENNKEDVIVSDNIAGPIEAFANNVVITGSFLWISIDKLWKSNWSAVLEKEKTLLEKHKPKMFGVDPIAMPDVYTYTRFTGFPWFCERTQSHSGKRTTLSSNILITAGGTSNSHLLFGHLALQLINQGIFKVYVDKGLHQYLSARQYHATLFDFSDTSYHSLRCMIARPGIGSITDCVKYGIPLICAGEKKQDELIHNASVVEKKMLGANLLGYTDEEIFFRTNSYIINETLLKEWKQNLLLETVNGASQVADQLINLSK